MNRRELLQRSALALGYAITGPTLIGVLNGCSAKPELAFVAEFFNEDQARLVADLSDIILPRTSTPGAKDVGVPLFIDSMLKNVYSKDDQEKFISGLVEFDKAAKDELGKSFADCSPEAQSSFAKKIHDQALGDATERPSARYGGKKIDRPFILKMKELTIIGFFTSEPGATQVLKYEQVPGPFKGCVPYTEVGKQWAT